MILSAFMFGCTNSEEVEVSIYESNDTVYNDVQEGTVVLTLDLSEGFLDSDIVYADRGSSISLYVFLDEGNHTFSIDSYVDEVSIRGENNFPIEAENAGRYAINLDGIEIGTFIVN